MTLLSKITEIFNVSPNILLQDKAFFYIESSSKNLIKVDRSLVIKRINNIIFYYLFEWNGDLHIKGLEFISSITLLKKQNSINGFKNDQNIVFLSKLEDNALIKVVNEELEQVDFYILNKSSSCKCLNSKIINPKSIVNEGILSINYGLLSYYSQKNNNEIWKINFNQILKNKEDSFYSNIIEYKNCLYIFISNLDKGRILCIETATGNILHQTAQMGGWLTLANEKIYVANQTYIQILNPDTFEIQSVDFSEVLTPLGLKMVWNKFVVSGNEFYFVHEHARGGSEAVVGILDIDTQQLLWHTTISIEEDNFFISEIKVHQNRLYVLTQGGTLHIFEKEAV